MKYIILITCILSVLAIQASIDMDRYTEDQVRACYESIFQKPAKNSTIQAIMKGDYNWITNESQDDVNEFQNCLEKTLE